MSALTELGSIRKGGVRPENKDNKAAAGFLTPWGIGPDRHHHRADARLAVSLVHQLQPVAGAEVDRPGQLHPDAATTRGCSTRCG